MKFDFNKVFNSLKKLSPALIAVFVTSGFAIFAPDFILAKLGIQQLSLTVRQIIGGVFILSCSLIIVIISSAIIKYCRNRFLSKKALKNLEAEFELLSHDELIRILMMFHSSGHNISMSIQDGVTGALISKKLIALASNVPDNVGLLTYQCVLQPWVIKYLNNHRDDYKITFEEIEQEYNDYICMLREF